MAFRRLLRFFPVLLASICISAGGIALAGGHVPLISAKAASSHGKSEGHGKGHGKGGCGRYKEDDCPKPPKPPKPPHKPPKPHHHH